MLFFQWQLCFESRTSQAKAFASDPKLLAKAAFCTITAASALNMGSSLALHNQFCALLYTFVLQSLQQCAKHGIKPRFAQSKDPSSANHPPTLAQSFICWGESHAAELLVVSMICIYDVIVLYLPIVRDLLR